MASFEKEQESSGDEFFDACDSEECLLNAGSKLEDHR